MIFIHCQSNKPKTNVLLFELFAKLLSVSHICVSVFVESHPVGNRVANSEMMKPLSRDRVHQAFHPAFPKVFPVHLKPAVVIIKPPIHGQALKSPSECGTFYDMCFFDVPFTGYSFVYPALTNNPLVQWNMGTSGVVMCI